MALTDEDWRVLRAIDTGAPHYIRYSVVDRLKNFGLLTFSWKRRGLVLTATGKFALRADEILLHYMQSTGQAEQVGKT